jgi:hypothetical protein
VLLSIRRDTAFRRAIRSTPKHSTVHTSTDRAPAGRRRGRSRPPTTSSST